MCGIHAAIRRSAGTDALPAFLHHCLCNRGPDHFGQVTTRLKAPNTDNDDAFLTFTSTVLSLRGDHVTKQPFQEQPSGSVLCWNGEAWRIGGRTVQGNDGEAVFALLSNASSRNGASDAILEALRSIEGPFAFVYFDAPSKTLYFGRDRLGRRSLLMCHDDTESSLVISSVAETCEDKWNEVEADGVYSLAFHEDMFSSPYAPPSRHEWLPGTAAEFVSSIGRFNTALPTGNTALLSTSPAVSSLREQLAASLSLRVLNVPEPPVNGSAANTRVAVLFSGGLDCTVLARLSHDLLPPDQAVDLLNVAFENPRVAAQLQKQAKGAPVDVYEACPDRITGRKAYAELQSVCPGRVFRFVAVNVPYTETCAHRAQIISLIYPHNTEMDLSIACALYFAARGQGFCYEGPNPDISAVVYTTPARVLLSGLGADELFGGYVRHPSAFERAGYPGLIDELKLDVGRLGKRNLGRDDRAMAHWGKEVRFPFLDERLVKWAIETPAWEKCDFDNAEEISGVEAGKRVLRLLSLELGMEQVAREKKRAVRITTIDHTHPHNTGSTAILGY
ncbi:asparagine synthase [Coniochaeta sp. PMI_546]|nr:asparagine synthase [Coniochaeta sp. PMI_546]